MKSVLILISFLLVVDFAAFDGQYLKAGVFHAKQQVYAANRSLNRWMLSGF
jgi:hypothetical protein